MPNCDFNKVELIFQEHLWTAASEKALSSMFDWVKTPVEAVIFQKNITYKK